MAAYDRLPPPLRLWLAGAALPWSAASVLRLWHRALRETGCPNLALGRLTAAEGRTLAREAAAVWGAGHPQAGPAGAVAPCGWPAKPGSAGRLADGAGPADVRP
jgi:hypothetical protein